MKTSAVLEVALDIPDPISFIADAGALMSTLRARYEGKCYSGRYILTVDEILQRSNCIIDGLSGAGAISVKIAVSCEELAEGEIISGCIVQHIPANAPFIFLVRGYIRGIVDKTAPMPPMSKGLMIPVRVLAAVYRQGSPAIEIKAAPLIHERTAPLYRVGPIEEPMTGVVAALVAKIKSAEAACDRSAESWKVFSQLFTAYKSPVAGQSLWELLENRTVAVVSRDPRLDLSAPSVVVAASSEEVSPVLPAQAWMAILSDYYDRLMLVYESTQIYSTSKLLADHATVWSFYRRTKFA
jgi:hypothetical protein